MTTSPAHIVAHIVPQDIARGAQRYAAFIARELDDGRRHELVTLFDSTTSDIDPEHELRVPSGRMRQAGLDLRALVALRSKLTRLAPDILVAHGGEALKYAALASPRSLELIYVRIGVSTDKARALRRRMFQSWLIRKPDHIVAVSEAVRDELVDAYRTPRDKVTVIPNSRDESMFVPRTQHASREDPTVTFVGHLIASKRPDLFIELVTRLRARGVAFNAQIVGSGPLYPKVTELAVAAQVEVLGERDNIPALLRETDLFVFTSVREGEGMPGVLIEAALSGVPIVSTDVPGASDVIEDGVSGFLVQVDDVDQLEDRVMTLLLDSSRRNAMGQAARKRAEKRFTLSATSRLWSQVLNNFT